MVSPVLNEAFYTGAFLVRPADGNIWIDPGAINNSTGTDVQLNGGLVLARASNGTASATAGTNTGNGTMGAVTVNQAAKPGSYVFTATGAATFTAIDPQGYELQNVTVGAAYNDAELGFTITAGGTAFVAGDKFTVVVTAASNVYTPYSTTSGPAVGILFNRTTVPASSSKTVGVVTRLAEVNVSELQWDATITGSGSMAALQAAALASLALSDIIGR